MKTVSLESLYVGTVLTFCENAAELGCPKDKEVDMWFRELSPEEQLKVAERMMAIEERDAKRFAKKKPAKKTPAKKKHYVNKGWVYFHDESRLMADDEPLSYNGKTYYHFYVVLKKFWEKHGHLDEDTYYRAKNDKTLRFPPDCGEYIESGIEVPGTLEEAKALLEEWGFEPADMSKKRFNW